MVRGSILGIQAKRRNKTTRSNQKETCHQGGEAERGGRPKHYTRHTTKPGRNQTEGGGEEPGGSRGQRENMTHPQQEEYERALAESREGPGIIR